MGGNFFRGQWKGAYWSRWNSCRMIHSVLWNNTISAEVIRRIFYRFLESTAYESNICLGDLDAQYLVLFNDSGYINVRRRTCLKVTRLGRLSNEEDRRRLKVIETTLLVVTVVEWTLGGR